jgi:competence protein ComEA
VDNLLENIKNYKIPLILCLVGAVLILGGVYSSNLSPAKKTAFPDKSKVLSAEIKQSSEEAKIDISGAIKAPAVYSLSKDARVEEVIQKAGGFTSNANKEYIAKHLNLSQKISDGMKIYVPFQGEDQLIINSSDPQSSKVSINQGSLKELDSLPGVGLVSAQKIIDARPFNKIEDLVAKKAISKTVFEKIKELIQLD